MTSNSIQHMTRVCVIAMALLIAFVLPLSGAQESATPAAVKQPKPARHSVEWIEMRITKLHDQLHITPDQEPAWKKVDTAMRENAKSMKALYDQWGKQADKMSALESMRMQGEMAEEHAKGQRNLIPAFEALYSMMSPEQKTIADLVFAKHEGRRHEGKK